MSHSNPKTDDGVYRISKGGLVSLGDSPCSLQGVVR